MKRFSRSTIAVCVSVLALSASTIAAKSPPKRAPIEPPLPTGLMRGVAIGQHTDISTSLLERNLSEVKALGASHVSMVASWSTKDVKSTKIAPRAGFTPVDRSLARMISRAHARGLGVFLFPIIDLQRRKPLEWRGKINPTNWDAWWRSYRRFILHYARIAARGKVELFCIGSELVSTEKMRDRWIALIKDVRAIYRGAIVYSANWDHYEPVTFWDHIDVMGITGYYGLAKKKDASQASMVVEWKKVRKKLVAWSKRTKRRFIFTEVGYPNLDGAAVHPWDYTQGTPPDPEEQRRGFGAFGEAWSGVPELAGVFFWDWYGEGGPKDRSYTPRGKPAAKEIERWFKSRADAEKKPAGKRTRARKRKTKRR